MNNILEYLEQTAEKYPWEEAVDDGNIKLAWSELLTLSKCIGTAIAEKTNTGEPVAILAEKSAVTLAVMYGCVYAGCFYVVINTAQPVERMKEILNSLSPHLVITTKESSLLLEETEYDKYKCLISELVQAKIDEDKLACIRQASRASDILYGIFTSGSTGRPKGIVVSHRAVIDFISHFVETFHITRRDRLGNQAPFDFDVSVKDIYSCAMTGASLVLISKKLFSMPPLLLDYICEKKITTLIWAVSALTLVSSLKGLDYKIPVTVKRILFSGEVMPVSQLLLWQKALPDTEFVNLYGPTEITCNCLYYRVEHDLDEKNKLPIGKAFDGRLVFLQDEEGNIVTDINKKGEICVAGESLATGYYHNPEETNKRFMVKKKDGQTTRYYCTGDIGYLDEEGNFYFAGRRDFQIKHMGHRIELEEIECALSQLPGIEKNCCLMDEAKNKLVDFYMGEISADHVRLLLKKKLPSYMIPQKLIKINMMPLNKNGKTDRGYLKRKLEDFR